MVPPAMPSSASLGTSSKGNSARSQYSLIRGVTSFSQKARTRSRISISSGSRSSSTAHRPTRATPGAPALPRGRRPVGDRAVEGRIRGLPALAGGPLIGGGAGGRDGTGGGGGGGTGGAPGGGRRLGACGGGGAGCGGGTGDGGRPLR